jgi:outer membrane receptor protein involved in Fe transport
VTLWDSRFSITTGVRFDHFSLTGQTIWMPRVNVALSPLRKTRVTLGYGQYSQFPEFIQMFGEFGNPRLRAERATHYVLGVEHLITEKTRVRIEGYDREDRNGIYSAANEIRLVNGVPLSPRAGVIPGAQTSFSAGFHTPTLAPERGMPPPVSIGTAISTSRTLSTCMLHIAGPAV